MAETINKPTSSIDIFFSVYVSIRCWYCISSYVFNEYLVQLGLGYIKFLSDMTDSVVIK